MASSPVSAPSQTGLRIRAADLSFTPEILSAGTVFHDSTGRQRELLDIFRQAGCNAVRLRLWHGQDLSHSALEDVADFNDRLHDAGFQVILDIHYSDTWADPGKQGKPNSWKDLAFDALVDSVYAYTGMVLKRIEPEYVQIGNEINNGFLWPEGRIDHMRRFVTLLKEGIRAARQYDSELPVTIHFAGYRGSRDFYGMLAEEKVDYDIIGLSYYPSWHGKDMDRLASTLELIHFRGEVGGHEALPLPICCSEGIGS